MLEINRLGGGLVALLVTGCGGDGDGAGLLLRKDSGDVARSSSVLSRSIDKKREKCSIIFQHYGELLFTKNPESLSQL